MVKVGDKVCNKRRPDKIGTVVSLQAPVNEWLTSPDHMRVLVHYKQLTKTSRGTWKSGTIDELPQDLLPYGEGLPVVIEPRKEGGVAERILASHKKRRKRL